jgi:uncharacterized membrane protein
VSTTTRASGSTRTSGAGRSSRRATLVGLPLVLSVTCLSLLASVALRAPCVGADWSTGVQYRTFCYSDVLALYEQRGLADGKIPYLDERFEYPVLIGAFAAATGLPAPNGGAAFALSILGLGGLALVTAAGLWRIAGSRALVFAAAPTLVLYGLVNWDLIAVALATLATAAFLRRRDAAAGVLLGLGAAAKLYPALLVLPFAWQRWRDGDRRDATRLVVAGVGAWVLVNAPVMLLAPHGWSYFFRFNAARGADWGSVWATVCDAGVVGLCARTATVNAVSTAAFALGAIGIWIAWRRLDLAPWTSAFALVVVFLLTNKVYSPQYSLWVLPWIVVLAVDLRWFAAFEAADAAVFVAHFSWQARLMGIGGAPLGMLEAASLVRAALLVGMLVVAVRATAGDQLRTNTAPSSSA